jgi:hypothetical protein
VKDSKASLCNPFFAESDLERIAIHGKKDETAPPRICARR